MQPAHIEGCGLGHKSTFTVALLFFTKALCAKISIAMSNFHCWSLQQNKSICVKLKSLNQINIFFSFLYFITILGLKKKILFPMSPGSLVMGEQQKFPQAPFSFLRLLLTWNQYKAIPIHSLLQCLQWLFYKHSFKNRVRSCNMQRNVGQTRVLYWGELQWVVGETQWISSSCRNPKGPCNFHETDTKDFFSLFSSFSLVSKGNTCTSS